MFETLSREDRLRLMRFVCSFAWADLEVSDEERAFVADLVQRLALDDDEARQIQQWLNVPPAPEEIDPTDVPPEHRRIFLDTVMRLVTSDGRFSEAEREHLRLFQALLP